MDVADTDGADEDNNDGEDDASSTATMVLGVS